MPCLDENTALQFVEGLLEQERAREVEAHVASCEDCRWLLTAAGGAALDEFPTSAPTRKERVEEEEPFPFLDPMGAQSRIGVLLNDTFIIQRFIGSGGMGAVYEATHRRLPRRFAIKLLAADLKEDPQAIARMRQEAEITSRLSHPHIVEVFDFNYTPEGTPFIAMEFLSGEPLSTRLRREKTIRSLAEIATIIRQTTSALAAAHAQRVVHRDLKPNNIFLCDTEDRSIEIKVMDFGISKILGIRNELTGNISVLGSPCYMSPEQAQGNSAAVDQRADIFAMGAIIYRMLAGRSPFLGSSIPSTLYKVVHETPGATPDWQAVPRPLQEVVLRALSKKIEARQSSMEELWEEFALALRLLGLEDALKTATLHTEELLLSPSLRSSTSQIKQMNALPWSGRRRRFPLTAWIGGFFLSGLGALLALWLWPAGGGRVASSPLPPPDLVAMRSGTDPADDGGERAIPARGDAPRPGESGAAALALARDLGPRRIPRKVSPRTPAGIAASSKLTIQSKDASDGRYLWARVYLDGRQVGLTPLTLERLSPGLHRVEIRRPGFQTVSRPVTLTRGAAVKLSISLRAIAPAAGGE